MNRQGIFVISLDFELLWGILDQPNYIQYARNNIANVAKVIDKLIDLFKQYEINATFATVGFVMCHSFEELESYSPIQKPTYSQQNLSPYNELVKRLATSNPEWFFAPKIVQKLINTENIEVASHTFSHYYCWESGQTPMQFEEDIRASIQIAKDYGVSTESIVFPRNNVNDDYLKICRSLGIKSYRGNPQLFFGRSSNSFNRIWNRGCRLIDSYLPISHHTSYRIENISVCADLPINIPASRFLRPYSPSLHRLESIKINRIISEIKQAAENNEIYHLWWHPHNFGNYMENNINNLRKILQAYSDCKKNLGMRSYSMVSLCDYFTSINNSERL